MVDFGKNSDKHSLDQNSKPESDAKTAGNSDIATAEYSFFHIHQIKAWAGWSVDQAESDYTVDPPLYLNA
jgi:hypothetical protein